MPKIPALTTLPDGSMAFRHGTTLVTIIASHDDRRRLRWWSAQVDGRAITAAVSTPRIAAALAIAALRRG